jgi:hypothetical protein
LGLAHRRQNFAFASHRIEALPIIARDMSPGMGNFCVLTDTPVADVVARLKREGVAIVDGPASALAPPGRCCRSISRTRTAISLR